MPCVTHSVTCHTINLTCDNLKKKNLTSIICFLFIVYTLNIFLLNFKDLILYNLHLWLYPTPQYFHPLNFLYMEYNILHTLTEWKMLFIRDMDQCSCRSSLKNPKKERGTRNNNHTKQI